MIDPREANLTLLRKLTSDICEQAGDVPALKADGINYGDLRCYSAERCEDEDGHWTLRVWIEEASPDASAFHEYVRSSLARQGYQVIVHTEW